MNKANLFLKQYHPIVHTLLFGTFLIALAQSMSLLFLPIYLVKELHMDPVVIGLTVGAGPLAATFGGFIAGIVSDRIGRRKVLLASLLLSSFSFLGFVFAETPIFLIILVILIGLSNSFFTPVAKALMGDVTDADKRVRVFSLRYVVNNLGFAIGPIIGAYLALSANEVPFLIAACLYLGFTILLHILLKRFGIKQIEAQDTEKITLRKSLSVLRSDTILLYFVIGGIICMVVHGQWSVTVSQYLENDFTNGVQLFAIILIANSVGVISMQYPITRWAEKRTPLFTIIIGCIFTAFGMLLFAFSGNAVMFVISTIIFTLGEVLVIPAEYTLIDQITPKALRGTYYGAQSFNSLGSFIGPMLGGFMLKQFSGTAFFLTMALISILSILFFWRGVNLFKNKNTTSNVDFEKRLIKSNSQTSILR
ncbi:MDR family MFS transporter [Cytobacillus solani]|uniref:MDR family MFS transporter n=1 Tax=Cytobacillus solani TaxID=1637975 RepID=UPI0015EF4164|nr:MFS transporter [Cytobacillus solani]